MNKREQIKEIIDSMMDYFDVDDFDDLDSLMQMDLLAEVEECLDINIPMSFLDKEMNRKEFTLGVLAIYEGQPFE
jgi:acyl carrier protein